MPVGIYKPLEKVRGLPSDEEISEWCKRLRLCIDAINAEADYDAKTSGYTDEDEFNNEMQYYSDQIALYQTAMDALKALLPDDSAG